jgi:hypothetical protein
MALSEAVLFYTPWVGSVSAQGAIYGRALVFPLEVLCMRLGLTPSGELRVLVWGKEGRIHGKVSKQLIGIVLVPHVHNGRPGAGTMGLLAAGAGPARAVVLARWILFPS